MKTISEVKEICEVLKNTAEEVQEILSNEERDRFALEFLRYVENTYRKEDDRYYFKNALLPMVHRSADEVLQNFIYTMMDYKGK